MKKADDENHYKYPEVRLREDLRAALETAGLKYERPESWSMSGNAVGDLIRAAYGDDRNG